MIRYHFALTFSPRLSKRNNSQYHGQVILGGMHNIGQAYTTTKALSKQLVKFLFAPNSSELKQETTPYKSLELGQIMQASGHDSVDSVDLCVVGNAVDNSVCLNNWSRINHWSYIRHMLTMLTVPLEPSMFLLRDSVSIMLFLLG